MATRSTLSRQLGATLVAGGLSLAPAGWTDNLTDGVAFALPVPNGKAPTIDGKLDDWDLNAAEPCWIGFETVARQNAVVAYMYDEQALYVGAEVTLPGRSIHNPNRPVDRFWHGDLLQLRLSSDPALPFPLPSRTHPALADNPRTMSINMWKNTATGEDIIQFQFGAALNLGSAVNPEGTDIAIQPRENGYTLEAKISWAAMQVPDGRLPFAPGQRMTALMEVLWEGGDAGRATMHFHQDPGTFGFLNVQTWGQIEFSPVGNLEARHGGLAAIIQQAQEAQVPVGTPIHIDIPERAKVTVNLVDEQGAVLRELLGGEWHDAGTLTAWWDGRDQWGHPLPLGEYRWRAYLHQGIDVEYFGTVGTSGTPPYETPDGTGGWGGDHGPPIAAAADDTGWYFVWNANESGRSIVKTDFEGKVIWRVSPFVAGGYGGYTAVAANGRRVYLVIDAKGSQQLVKLDAASGDFLPFPTGNTLLLDFADQPPELPAEAWPGTMRVVSSGVACGGDRVYVGDAAGNRIVIINGENGERLGELACPGPRGLCLANGQLYVASYDAATNAGAILRLAPGTDAPPEVLVRGLAAPWGVAVDADGRLHATDLGASQQVKVFAPDGQPLRTLGQAGGRPFLGRYSPTDFRHPVGLAWDGKGGILVAEASAPKVFTRLDAASGETLSKWFGYTAYSPSNVPDPDEPLLQYYSLAGPNSFARARLPEDGGLGQPDAAWDFPAAGIDDFGSIMNTMVIPEVVKADNGRKYLVADGFSEHTVGARTICLIDGDAILPVASLTVERLPDADEKLPDGKTRRVRVERLRLWADANGDHRPQPEEITAIDQVDGRSLQWAVQTGSLTMCANGDLYLTTQNNAVVLIPGAGFAADGSLRWEVAKARLAIPTVVPGVERIFTGWRTGILGVRRDTGGNLYLVVNGDDFPYATEALSKRMRQGMGHTSARNAVKVAKYDPSGQLLWMAGRKATATPGPGEMMHHWVIGGLLDDRYLVACSEWGTFAVYTHDGFYVDTLFDLPGVPGRGWPYTFGGECFSGQIRYFPARDEVWAYNAGHTFRVNGFEHGRVKGERRLDGIMALAKVEPLAGEEPEKSPLKAVALAGDPNDASTWADIPATTLMADGRELASFQLAYTETDLLFRARVHDATPLVNTATHLNAIFKGGDAVGLQIGPADAPASRQPLVGMTRFLAAHLDGQPQLVAMKPLTRLAQKPDSFATPAAGTADFEFLGEVPGGQLTLTPEADGQGYTCIARLPLAFLEVEFKPGTKLAAELELLLSGQGQRGIETVSRHYHFSPSSAKTTMVNDTPTEARLYPDGWGVLQVQ